MRNASVLEQATKLCSQFVIWKHYYVYVNSLSEADSTPASIAGASFTFRKLPITLAEYESVARAGGDLREIPVGAAPMPNAPRTFVFLAVSDDAVVNVTGMTATRSGSVYSHIRRFWPSVSDDDTTLFAGCSETAPMHRRKGVYS